VVPVGPPRSRVRAGARTVTQVKIAARAGAADNGAGPAVRTGPSQQGASSPSSPGPGAVSVSPQEGY
jgi:hypothetical protein